MTKTKRVTIIIFVMFLAVLMSVPTSADIVPSNKVSETIDVQLKSLLKLSSAEERIPVTIWLYETSTIADREQKVYSQIGLSKAQFTLDTRGAMSAKLVDEYIMAERSMYAEERAQQYADLCREYSNVRGLQEDRAEDTHLFFSKYAPMIGAKLTPAEIELLARDNRVSNIYYSPVVELVDESDVSIPLIDADYVRDNLGYSGSGIKIGMVERYLPDKNQPYFETARIHYDENLGEITQGDYSDHANTVAAIMVGKSTVKDGVTYEGIVPDAELYATCSMSTEDWCERVEWLISQGVHVINMSAGLPDIGYYNTYEAWVDHIAINHSVHFVKSAGNSNSGVTSPGMAYNIITVGAIDDKNTPNFDIDDVLEENSSYIEYGNPINGIIPTNKPDLVAPGFDIYTAAYVNDEDYCNSGTSFAAPHVTAVVAQMCQRRPALKVQQDVMKAILTAAISHSTLCYTPADSNNYDKFGAGVVNADEAYYINNNYRFTMSNFAANSADGSQKTYTFSVSSADTRVRVSLSWLKYAVLSGTHSSNNPTDYPIANLDLYVYDPSGVLVGSSTTQYNNTEIVDFEVNTTGTYKIVVKQTTHSERAVYFGLAWW